MIVICLWGLTPKNYLRGHAFEKGSIMIGFLTGRLHSKQPPALVLDVNGVGYEIEAPMSTFYALGNLDATQTILTHLHVREDAMLLFGFATAVERALFKELIKVNGVGAKMALGVLSAMSVNDFVTAVEQENAVGLTSIPGVGKKTAERLIIEMRDRLKNWAIDKADKAKGDVDLGSESVFFNDIQESAIEALVSLGYKSTQADKMVRKIKDKNLSLESLIKQALQSVSIR